MIIHNNIYIQDLHLTENIITLVCNEIKRCIKLSLQVSNTVEQERRKIPYHINVISAAAKGNLKETAHSRILVDLLRKDRIREAFIKYFFPDLYLAAFGENGNEYKIPNPDTNRIDATIKNGKIYIIIENKVNGAIEQPGQIFRYVQIAKSNGYKKGNIYVLYLNARSHNKPSNISLTKDGLGKESILDFLGHDHLICRSYKEDIITWLKELYNNKEFLKTEPFIESAIIQYTDYLENMFELSNKYDNMNNQIELMLRQELKLDEIQSLTERIDKINEEIENVTFLKERLNILHEKYAKQIWEQWGENYRYKYKDSLKISINSQNIGFEFTYKGKEMRGCLQKEYDNIFWGIEQIDKNASNNTIEYFEKLIESTILQKKKGYENQWPIRNYTSYKNGLKRLVTLTDTIIEKSKTDNNLSLK